MGAGRHSSPPQQKPPRFFLNSGPTNEQLPPVILDETKAMPERPGSVVKSMKRAIADLAPELLREEKFAEARQYLRADHDKAAGARSKGLFHSEGPVAFYYTFAFITT